MYLKNYNKLAKKIKSKIVDIKKWEKMKYPILI